MILILVLAIASLARPEEQRDRNMADELDSDEVVMEEAGQAVCNITAVTNK